MVPVKPAPSPAKIAAKLAKTVRVAEEARRAQEAIVEDKAFMHRHSVDDKAARALTPARPTRADWLACVQVVVYYPKGKKWEERFYHGLAAEVGDSVLRKWDGKEFVQVKLRVEYGDGSHEVTRTQCTHTSTSVLILHNHNAHTAEW